MGPHNQIALRLNGGGRPRGNEYRVQRSDRSGNAAPSPHQTWRGLVIAQHSPPSSMPQRPSGFLLCSALALCLCAGACVKRSTPREADTPSSTSTPANTPPSTSLPIGFPNTSFVWTDLELGTAVQLLESEAAQGADRLPTSSTPDGIAFFQALRRAVGESHRLTSRQKVSFGNHYNRLLPLYVSAARRHKKLEREIALLIALEFELTDYFAQDRAFVAHRPPADGPGGTTTMVNTKGGDVLVFFEAGRDRIHRQIRDRLELLSKEGLFRPESRALILSYMVRHLPNISRLLQFGSLRPALEQNARRETVETNRAYYDALLAHPHLQ